MTHDDQPGSDAYPRRERTAPRRGERGDCCGEAEARPGRALGLVFVRAGPAEVGEHAIAEKLGDVSLEARDLAGHRVLVIPDQLAHLFGIEPGRERRRTHQVDEHHRQLPPLGLNRSRLRPLSRRLRQRDRRRRAGKGLDRLEHGLARPERESQLPKVDLGQLGQDLSRDFGILEGLCVALQPKTTKPFRDIHAKSPRARR